MRGYSLLFALTFAAFAFQPRTASGQADPHATASAPAVAQAQPREPKARTLPYHGKLAGVDKQTGTFRVGKRVFHVTAQTKIEKAGHPASLADGTVGQVVSGGYKKAADGKLVASSVYFGGKSGGSEDRNKPRKSQQ